MHLSRIGVLPLIFGLMAEHAGAQLPAQNPVIQSILDSVSSDRIFSNLETLVGFNTRQTNSDTSSASSGIGAARRWIFDQFQQYADDSDAVAIEPGYFTFNATACGVTGEHRNVLATIPGAVTPQRNFLVMGHLDSRNIMNCDNTGYAPGANDDCSGTSVAIELARVMSKFSLESSLILMAVTGEEQGLLGSTAFANAALQNGMRIDGVLTNDVVGNVEGCANPACPPGEPVIIDSTSVRHFAGAPDTVGSRQLSRYFKLQGLRYLPGFTVNLYKILDRPGRGGDHIPFYNNGFSSVRFTEANEMGDGTGANGRQHNVFDTISAYNTHKGYMANIARLTAAGFASLALAPQTPPAPQATDAGDGKSVHLTWTPSNTEPDFAGYRIAVRHPDSTFYSLPITDALNTSEYTLGGLVEGQRVYLSLSAYDSSGNESIFSTETGFTPFSQPRVPGSVSSTSTPGAVHLQWEANPELDVVRYRIYRSISRTSGFVLFDSVPVPGTSFTDGSLSPHQLFFYQVRACDLAGNESSPSMAAPGQLVTHDRGILVVDGTRDGAGTATAPTDAMVDDQYTFFLDGFTVGGEWDVADSLVDGVGISDAEMAPYSTVVWHTDVRGSAPLYQDSSALRKYLQHGGNLFLGGWRLSTSLKPGATAGIAVYPPGSFVPVYLKIDSTITSTPILQDFISATALLPEYQNLRVDSLRIPGALQNTDAVLLPFAGTTVDALYTHHGVSGTSTLEGKPVAWRYLGADFKVTVFDLPLYYMAPGPARSALRQALEDMGEVTLVGDNPQLPVPSGFVMYQNFPNPFNPLTGIRFALPHASAVTVVVYNTLGKEIRSIFKHVLPAGSHLVTWDGRNNNGEVSASGVYYCRLSATGLSGESPHFTQVRKMVYVK